MSKKGRTKQKQSSTNISNQGDTPISEQIERMKYSLDLENMWIGNADNKVNVACALHAGIFAVITFVSEQIGSKEEINECFEKAYWIFFVLSSIALVIAMVFYICALNPNLKSLSSEKANDEKDYPLYFGDIANDKLECYKNKMNLSAPDEFLDELIVETYTNAKICKKKMLWYRKGLWTTFASIAFLVVSLVMRFLM